jgi:hypothetical protein
MEARLELGTIVRLQCEDPERESLSNLVQEADGRTLIAPIVDLQDSDPRAVIDSGELIEPFARARNALKKLHVHLQAVAGLRFLIALPALLVWPMVDLGMDPVHFGIMLILNLGIGLVTPPVGSVLFVGCAVGKIPIEQTVRTIWPFYFALLAALVAVIYVPSLSLWLPQLLN